MATALPSTSARSQAPMATSQNSQLGQRVHAGYQSRQALGQVFAGGHAEAGGDDLHKNGHEAGQRYHPQQAILELRPARSRCPSCPGSI